MRPTLVVTSLLLLSAAALPGPAGAAGGPGTPFSSSATASNFPPGCGNDLDDGCYHMRQGLNALDSPKIDVLILAPASPWAERDLRAMRAAVEMWESGLLQLADERGWDWLADGVEFHVSTDLVAPAYGASGEFSTYPFYDPEIVVIAADPVVGYVQGIGIDPHATAGEVGLDFLFGGETPCHGADNPFDIAAWEAVPGFDSHHGGRGGTYVEDCGGAGGNVCFAVNLAIDPVPGVVDDVLGMNMHDLVAHEVGHCLTLGHVGDAGDHTAAAFPRDDVMSYTNDPGISGRKCASTLDLEVFAITMSGHLDVDGSGAVDASDRLYPNDHVGDLATSAAGNPMQVQHPSAHRYASPTGLAADCPWPDTALVSGFEAPGSAPPDPALQSGVPVDVTMAQGDDLAFYIDVPSGAPSLTTEVHHACATLYVGLGCTLDVDLYVRHGAPPTDDAYDCRPFAALEDEACSSAGPAAGRWHVRLVAFTGAGTVRLTSTVGAAVDSDGDGTPDASDDDRDGDLFPDAVEAAAGSDPADPASEPGTPDTELCTANAGSTAAPLDQDGDGVPALYARTHTTRWTVEDGVPSFTVTKQPCWLAGDLDDDGTERAGAAGPLPVEGTAFCSANGGSTVASLDKDRDGVPAAYARTRSTDWAVSPRGDLAFKVVSTDCWVAGDLDDDGAERTAAAGPLPIAQTSFCTANGGSTAKALDKDGDGVPAAYARTKSTAWRVEPDGSAGFTITTRDCWVAGDLDDDGVSRLP